MTAAKGPPNAAAAMMGAVVTLTIAPLGIRTGIEELSKTTAVQNVSPSQPPIAG
jgi:hypothetical protein